MFPLKVSGVFRNENFLRFVNNWDQIFRNCAFRRLALRIWIDISWLPSDVVPFPRDPSVNFEGDACSDSGPVCLHSEYLWGLYHFKTLQTTSKIIIKSSKSPKAVIKYHITCFSVILWLFNELKWNPNLSLWSFFIHLVHFP